MLALALRVGFLAYDTPFRPYADAADFDRVAVHLVDHGDYPPSDIAHGGPSGFRPPGYPYLLAAVYALTGTSHSTSRYTVARVLSAVLSTITVGLIGVLAWLLFGAGATLPALIAAAVYPPLVTIGDAMLSEPMFAVLVLGAVAAVLLARKAERPFQWAVVSGVLIGLAALTRTNGIIVAPVLGVGLWSAPRLSWPSLRAPLVFLACVIVTLAPWMIRNAFAFHSFVPVSTQDGFTLAGTYNHVSLENMTHPAAWRPPNMAPYTEVRRRSPHADEAVLDDRFRADALTFAENHPSYIPKVAYYNLSRLLDLQGASVEHPSAGESGFGDGVSNLDVYSFYVLGLVAIAALLLGVTRLTPVFVWIVPLAIAGSLVFVISYMRYRFPIDPFLLLLAAGLATRLRSGRSQPGRLQNQSAVADSGG